MASRLGMPKSDLLDPQSSNSAIKQAQAETHAIQEAKYYFESRGIDVTSFSSRDREGAAVLVKNFKFGTKPEDLLKLFSGYGEVVRVLMPPTAAIAVVELQNKVQAGAAFQALAYRKLGDSVLFLERAPKALFESALHSVSREPSSSKNTPDLPPLADDRADVGTNTLYITNLSFKTSQARFQGIFRSLDGFVSARIKCKQDPSRTNSFLSMGFGFVEFRTPEQARGAMLAMNGFTLDDYKLLVKASEDSRDAASERRVGEQSKPQKFRNTKIVIKNLPFEASKQDVCSLLRNYGQLRSVRLPKRIDKSRRGFAFAEFANPREAHSAKHALQNTHLLGRRLVLDYATEDSTDPEEEIQKIQQRVGRQSNSLALQDLADRERRKITINQEGEKD